MNTKHSILVLFDLDGTLTKKDTLMEFIRYCFPKKFVPGFLLLSPLMALYIVGLISDGRTKEIVMSFFFKGMNDEKFKKHGRDFATNILPSLLRPEGRDAIKHHQNQHSRMVIVSASFSAWITPWAEQMNIEVLATEHETRNNQLNGKILGKNCKGNEKVRRIKANYNLTHYDTIFAYGNSKGDKEMLKLADEKYMRWKKQDN